MELSKIYNCGYEAILVAMSAVFVAQILKVILHLVTKRNVDFRLFTTTGGMPSSHAAGVMGLTTSVALITGINSIETAISLGFALIVMYDAAGVRRAAGKQAKLLNKIVETPGLSGVQVTEKLVEVLGHTPTQVIVGAIIGVIVGIVF